MEKPILDPEEWVVSLTDVKQLYKSMGRKLLKWAVLGAVTAFLATGIMKVKYKAEAKFKEGIEKTSTDNVLKELMGGVGAGQQPQAASIMKSYQVLKPLVEKMGLQISPPPSGWLPLKVLRRYRESWQAEKGKVLEDLDSFAFQDVSYEKEKETSFYLVFKEHGNFQIYDERKEVEIGQGKIGEPIHLETPPLQFTLKNLPQNLKTDSYYRFSVQNWASVANGIRSGVQIRGDKDNKSLIHVSFSNRDRHFAAELINELMRQYQAYLKREFQQMAKEQLAYLEKKQSETLSQMGSMITERADYLSQNLRESGFPSLAQDGGSMIVPYQEMQKKAFLIDVELSRIQRIEEEQILIPFGEETAFSSGLYRIAEKIHELKQQRDLIELSLGQVAEAAFQMRKDELEAVRNQRLSVEKLLQEVDLKQEISSFDWSPSLALWAKSVSDPEEREDLTEYLENYARILSMREKMLQERFFFSNTSPPELEGMDLVSAQALFLEYNTKLDAAEASMRYYSQFKKEIPNPNFDLGSLSSVLKDSFCQRIIGESAQLSLQLKDEKHHTTKEAERWKEEIALHRKILRDHLEHLYQVEEINADLIRKKMGGLQSLTLDGINRQISVFYEQFNSTLKEKKEALLLEKDLLEKRMGEMRSSLATLMPEKWRFERWFSLKSLMIEKVMSTMTEAVESKTISTHLHQVASKPLDIAVPPLAPEKPKLYLLSCLGAFASSFLVFLAALVRRLIKGFPLSLEKMKTLRLPVAGQLSFFCDGPHVEIPSGPDLDLLRNIGQFSEGAKVVGLIGGKGPDYTYALGENLGRRFAKSIMVRCDFNSKFRKEDAPGLLQLWKGEVGELPIRKGKGFDYILAGGYTPFGTEIIQSPQFKQLIEALKKNYDWVFLYSKAPLSSAEPLITLNLCDKAVVTVSNEKTEELTRFVDWGYDHQSCRITFVTER